MPNSVKDRPNTAHEPVFMLAKRRRYFYDAEAIKEPASENTHSRGSGVYRKLLEQGDVEGVRACMSWAASTLDVLAYRNKRTVWTIPTAPYEGAHYATFPPRLVEPMIKAGTSEAGYCSECGKPWVRITERTPMVIARSDRAAQMGEYGRTQASGTMLEPASSKTIGWRPTCTCSAPPRAGRVFDPFAGSGTTPATAVALGRVGIGCELSATYLTEHAAPRLATAWQERQETERRRQDFADALAGRAVRAVEVKPVELGPLFSLEVPA